MSMRRPLQRQQRADRSIAGAAKAKASAPIHVRAVTAAPRDHAFAWRSSGPVQRSSGRVRAVVKLGLPLEQCRESCFRFARRDRCCRCLRSARCGLLAQSRRPPFSEAACLLRPLRPGGDAVLPGGQMRRFPRPQARPQIRLGNVARAAARSLEEIRRQTEGATRPAPSRNRPLVDRLIGKAPCFARLRAGRDQRSGHVSVQRAGLPASAAVPRESDVRAITAAPRNHARAQQGSGVVQPRCGRVRAVVGSGLRQEQSP